MLAVPSFSLDEDLPWNRACILPLETLLVQGSLPGTCMSTWGENPALSINPLVPAIESERRSLSSAKSMQDTAMDAMPMEMKQSHSDLQDDDFRNGQWVEISNDRSPQESPLHEYNNSYAFMSSSHVSMDSIYSRQMPTSYAANPPLHPLIMPQWPSQITNPSEGTPQSIRLPRPLAPVSAIITPHSAPPAPSAPAPSTARKTLTDQDRRKMCQYHEDHPTVKQTEIGGESRFAVVIKFFRAFDTDASLSALFGVERR